MSAERGCAADRGAGSPPPGGAAGGGPAWGEELDRHRRPLFAHCYRLTGCAADAEDLVQETFARALHRPPPDREAPWRPWLFRVATRLALDHLRRRRRRYRGPWLPGPTPVEDLVEPPSRDPPAGPGEDAAARCELVESLSYAFLLALEALTPRQRAVLILREVVGLTVRETAELLEMGEANVKTTHHRARRAMAAYEARRRAAGAVPADLAERARELVARLLAGDAEGLSELLAADVRLVSDGGGEYFAAGVPIEGRDRVIRFLRGIARQAEAVRAVTPLRLNGLPAFSVELGPVPPGYAPRVVILLAAGAGGRIGAIHWIAASRKLAGVPGAARAEAVGTGAAGGDPGAPRD